MDDFPGLLAKDFGIKPQGKSAPMAPPRNPSSGTNYGFRSDFTRSSYGNDRSSSNSIFDDQDRDGLMFNDFYGGPPKYSSESRATAEQTSSYDYDSFFKDSKPPVFDKPVYDDDLFDGLPGVKSSSSASAAKYDNVFGISQSTSRSRDKSPGSSPFDDLLGNLGSKESETKTKSEKMKAEKDAPLFDDLLPSTSDAAPQKPASNSSKTGSNVMENPFHVFESTSDTVDSSSGLFVDPLEEITKLNGSGKSGVSSVNEGLFDDIDPLEGLGKSVPLSTEINKRGMDRNPLRTASGLQTPASKEPNDEDFEHYTKKRMPCTENFPESQQPVFDMPSMSTDFHSSVHHTASPPPYSNFGSNDTSSQVNATPRSEENFDTSEDVWLTVSEVPLFTLPTTQYKDTPHSTRAAAGSSVASQVDELEDFAMGRAWNNVDHAEDFSEAMDRAEAKFRHAKEMRERENLKAARNKEAGVMDKDERAMQDALGREAREKHERLEPAEARVRAERAAVEKAAAEARERAERAAVQRAQAEARQRAADEARERAERAAAEAREREAKEKEAQEKAERAEAKLRAERAAAEKAAAEARERAAASARASQQNNDNDLESFFSMGSRPSSAPRPRTNSSDPLFDGQNKGGPEVARGTSAGSSSSMRKASSSANIVDDLSSIFGGFASNSNKNDRTGTSSSRKRARSTFPDDLFEHFLVVDFEHTLDFPDVNFSVDDFELLHGFPDVTSLVFDFGQFLVVYSVLFLDFLDDAFALFPFVFSSFEFSSDFLDFVSNLDFLDDVSSDDDSELFLVDEDVPAASSFGEFQEVDGETEERRRARLERQQRTQERAAKALAEKNHRDLQVQREQAERHRISETLDVEIKRWAAGKEGNLRALLSTLQYVLWPECGWQPVSLTDLIMGAAVKKAYRKATLCIHPDKVQQKGANLQQKYVAEKVFDLLKVLGKSFDWSTSWLWGREKLGCRAFHHHLHTLVGIPEPPTLLSPAHYQCYYSGSSLVCMHVEPLVCNLMSKLIPSRGCVTCSAVQESSTPTTTAENKEEGKRPKPAAKSLPELMWEDVIPPLKTILESQHHLSQIQLSFQDNKLEGSFLKNGWPYSFWAFFPNEELTGPLKLNDGTVEPFLVDEKKITAKHVVFWVEKRLAAQGIIPVWKE
ncbi:hypothetical protein GOBAR_AA02957 [Gossypium barbadense]|uniref:J domain-containing protein n=1 Tax=Gossypium barbadense TaxID=3634 RepID=A0A2P5YPW3_GOSBA|nr:hypothetical protein GOBAR_AA02957 [Gossypium barbadense]